MASANLYKNPPGINKIFNCFYSYWTAQTLLKIRVKTLVLRKQDNLKEWGDWLAFIWRLYMLHIYIILALSLQNCQYNILEY